MALKNGSVTLAKNLTGSVNIIATNQHLLSILTKSSLNTYKALVRDPSFREPILKCLTELAYNYLRTSLPFSTAEKKFILNSEGKQFMKKLVKRKGRSMRLILKNISLVKHMLEPLWNNPNLSFLFS